MGGGQRTQREPTKTQREHGNTHKKASVVLQSWCLCIDSFLISRSVAPDLWPVYYTRGYLKGWQGMAVYCLEYVPSFQLAPQDLPWAPEVLGCRQLSWGLLRPRQDCCGDRASPWYILHLTVTWAMGLKLASRCVFFSPLECCMFKHWYSQTETFWFFKKEAGTCWAIHEAPLICIFHVSLFPGRTSSRFCA